MATVTREEWLESLATTDEYARTVWAEEKAAGVECPVFVVADDTYYTYDKDVDWVIYAHDTAKARYTYENQATEDFQLDPPACVTLDEANWQIVAQALVDAKAGYAVVDLREDFFE